MAKAPSKITVEIESASDLKEVVTASLLQEEVLDSDQEDNPLSEIVKGLIETVNDREDTSNGIKFEENPFHKQTFFKSSSIDPESKHVFKFFPIGQNTPLKMQAPVAIRVRATGTYVPGLNGTSYAVDMYLEEPLEVVGNSYTEAINNEPKILFIQTGIGESGRPVGKIIGKIHCVFSGREKVKELGGDKTYTRFRCITTVRSDSSVLDPRGTKIPAFVKPLNELIETTPAKLQGYRKYDPRPTPRVPPTSRRK